MVQKERKVNSTEKKKKKKKCLEKRYLTIDPGRNGGIAVLDNDNVKAYKCPEAFNLMAELIRKTVNDAYIDNYELVCIMEKVWAFPTDARSFAFKFGMNYGIWIGILEANNLKYELVTPKKWQSDYDLSKVKKDRKNELKTIAKAFYPKATLYNADAICIAVWARSNEK